MSLKISDLGTPRCIKDYGVRHWYAFGEGIGAVSVSVGSEGRHGTTFVCHTDTYSHTCVHIRALERFLDILDYRNERTHGAAA